MLGRLLPALLLLLIPAPVDAQAPRPVRVVIANGRLASVVDTPLYFNMARVTLPAGQSTSYTGPNSMVFTQAGTVELTLDNERRVLREGMATFLPGEKRATVAAAAGGAVVLQFALAGAGQVDKAWYAPPATVQELHRSREPLPNLRPGPYEFTLIRVSVDRGVPPPPMHQRSGAALYYVAAGTWKIHLADNRTEPRARGHVQLEPNGFFHTWENVGDNTGMLIQANISPEGVPEIIFLQR